MTAWVCDACEDGDRLDPGEECVTCGLLSPKPTDEDTALAEMQAAITAAKLKKEGPTDPEDLLSKFDALVSAPEVTLVQLDPDDGALDASSGLPPIVGHGVLLTVWEDGRGEEAAAIALNEATARLLAERLFTLSQGGEGFKWLDPNRLEGDSGDRGIYLTPISVHDSYPGQVTNVNAGISAPPPAIDPMQQALLEAQAAVAQQKKNAPRPIFGGNS